ncbi:MAG: tetratricopeptide repeat protein, partial [Gemmatimonadetes bacterium]|nr:tetratricopeptide repeat protein [Gemmatimonadota bacterium]
MRFFLIAPLIAVVAGCSVAPEDALTRAESALEAGRPRDAFRTLVPEAASRAESGEFHCLLANASFRTARVSAAAVSAGRACELLPSDPRPLALKAMADRRRSLVLQARESAAAAADLAPDGPAGSPYKVVLGETLLAQGRQGTPDHGAARDAFRAALETADPAGPVVAQARFGLARALVHGDEHEEAEPLLDRMIESDGMDFGDVRYLRGLTRLRARDFAGAADDFEWAARLGAPDPGVHFNRARALQRLGDRAGAEDERARYEAAREREEYVSGLLLSYCLESGDVAVATELGRVLIELRRYEDALDVLESLCFDQPKSPRPHVLWVR